MTVTSSTKLICFRRKRQESFKKSGKSSPLIDTLGRLKIHIALSNQANIDVRILGHSYCVAMVILSLLCFKREIEQDEIRKPLLIKLETEWIEWCSSSLLIPSILE